MMYSIDMSAAFNLLRPKLQEELMSDFPWAVKRSVMDFLTDGQRDVREIRGRNLNDKSTENGMYSG
jgi:hypothetical protein